MTTELWKLEKDLCRCCHAEGSFLNLAGIKGQEEQYSEMLRQSFNINLSPVSGPLYALTYTICEDCAVRLKDASSFKEQVLACEERFKELYERAVKGLDSKLGLDVKKETEDYDIKMEESAIDHNDIDDNDDIGDDGFETKFDDIVVDVHKPMLRILLEDCDVKVKRKTKPRVQPRAKRKNVKRSLRSQKAEDEADPDAEQDPEMDEGKDDAETATPAKKKSKNYTAVEVDGVQRYACNVCKKPFKNRCNISTHHRRVHLKEKLSRCNVCDVRMAAQYRAAHMQEVHGIPAPTCNICDKTFCYPNQVLRHQKTVHMGERDFECSACEMKFPTKDRLKRHEVKHSTARTFICNYCGKSFKWKKNLYSHIRIHLDDRQFTCALCGMTFVHKTSMRYHSERCHPNFENEKNYRARAHAQKKRLSGKDNMLSTSQTI